MRFRDFIKRPSLPLMGKELIEQAAQKRTYVLRVVYATLLFVGFAWSFSDILRAGLESGAQGVLGQGRDMFQRLVMLQFGGILVFLPAMMSGAIAAEKERASLGLLLLADLSPWSIIWQKYLGRLVPMFAFLLLSLPLMAVSYGFGGISPNYVWSGIILLVLACLQVGAFALMCSSWCRTSVGAFLAAYLGGALFYLTMPLAFWLLGISYNGGDTAELANGLFLFPPYVFGEWGDETILVVLLGSLILSTAVVFLVMARALLARRATVRPHYGTIGIFRALDRLFTNLNQRMGGVVLARGTLLLPNDEPVAWREMHRQPLGQLNHLVRLLVAMEAMVIFLGILLLDATKYDRQLFSSDLLNIFWVFAGLILIVRAADAIPRERMHQTLDALLTTPLTGREIVLQKMRPIFRLLIVLAVPLLTISAISAWWKTTLWKGEWLSLGRRPDILVAETPLLAATLSVIIYLPLIAWLSFWISLKARLKARAVTLAIGGIAVWCAAPLLLYSQTPEERGDIGTLVAFLSPASAVIISEFGPWSDLPFPSWRTIVLNFSFYGAILYVVRRACIQHADRYLRNEVSTRE